MKMYFAFAFKKRQSYAASLKAAVTEQGDIGSVVYMPGYRGWREWDCLGKRRMLKAKIPAGEYTAMEYSPQKC